MGQNAYVSKSNQPDEVTHRIRLLGVNGADPTEQTGGGGVASDRTGEGVYTLTFDENPGTFVGWTYGFGAATPADLKGYTAVRDTWDATNRIFTFIVYDSTFTAADIIADQYIDVNVTFKRTNVEG